MERIGIIAGSGQFPQIVAKELCAQGNQPVICGFVGHSSESLAENALDFKLLHLGQVAKLIDFFKKHNVKKLCFAGAISKPKALDLRPDFVAAKLLLMAKTKGDDSIFRVIIRYLEQEGFCVVSAADIAPSLRCPKGLLTKSKPNAMFEEDLEYGWNIAKNIGSYDIGQCLIVRRSMVVAVECLEGTDATIIRGAELAKKECVAIKMAKVGQDERVDLPSIGLKTIELLIEHNYLGLVIEAEKTLFFDREDAIKLANKHKLIIYAK